MGRVSGAGVVRAGTEPCGCSSRWTVHPTFERWNGPGQAIPARFRAYPHMSCDLRLSLAIKCSKPNSDVVWVLRHAREHGRPATGAKTSPRAWRGLILGDQIFSCNDTVSFKWDSRVGGEGCPVGAAAEVAVTKPNLPDRPNNLELEAATKAMAPDQSRRLGIVSWHASLSMLDHGS